MIINEYELNEALGELENIIKRHTTPEQQKRIEEEVNIIFGTRL